MKVHVHAECDEHISTRSCVKSAACRNRQPESTEGSLKNTCDLLDIDHLKTCAEPVIFALSRLLLARLLRLRVVVFGHPNALVFTRFKCEKALSP
jgi:hypothetical protein